MASFIVYGVVNIVLLILYAAAFVLFKKANPEYEAYKKRVAVVCGSLFFLASVIYTIVIAATGNISEGEWVAWACFMAAYIVSIVIIGFNRKKIAGEITNLFWKKPAELRDTRFDFI